MINSEQSATRRDNDQSEMTAQFLEQRAKTLELYWSRMTQHFEELWGDVIARVATPKHTNAIRVDGRQPQIV